MRRALKTTLIATALAWAGWHELRFQLIGAPWVGSIGRQ